VIKRLLTKIKEFTSDQADYADSKKVLESLEELDEKQKKGHDYFC
jgi:hypothetical protein